MANNHFGFALTPEHGEQPTIFLSVPWGTTLEETLEHRRTALEVQQLLEERGYTVHCPLLLHSFRRTPFMIAAFIARADALVVLNLPRCFECEKVKVDVTAAEGIGLPINLVTPGERIAAHLAGELAVEPDISPLLWQHACGHTGGEA